MILLLALAAPVAAQDHHGDGPCPQNLAKHSQAGWDLATTAEIDESHPVAASPCSMPCAQCGASMAELATRQVVSGHFTASPGLGNPSRSIAPFERPPRA